MWPLKTTDSDGWPARAGSEAGSTGVVVVVVVVVVLAALATVPARERLPAPHEPQVPHDSVAGVVAPSGGCCCGCSWSMVGERRSERERVLGELRRVKFFLGNGALAQRRAVTGGDD